MTFGASGPGDGRSGHQLSEPAKVRPTLPPKPSYGPAGFGSLVSGTGGSVRRVNDA